MIYDSKNFRIYIITENSSAHIISNWATYFWKQKTPQIFTVYFHIPNNLHF